MAYAIMAARLTKGRQKDMTTRQSVRKKQRANLEYSYGWFVRAQRDFNAFKMLVKFNRDSHDAVPCKDPALAVYLLQQSIEKAAKAVAAATGKYSYSRLKSHGHNSLVMLLDFYQEILNMMVSGEGIGAVFEAFGLDVGNGVDKVSSLKMAAAKKPKDRQKGEVLYSEQFATASADEIDGILDFLLLLRNDAFLGALKKIFGPHSRVTINGEGLDTRTSEDLVASFSREAGKQLNFPELSQVQLKAMSKLLDILAHGPLEQEHVAGKRFTVTRDTTGQLGQWSLIALIFLAAFTFPHESTSRYPGPRRKKATYAPLGCEDYNQSRGLVNRFGRLGYVTMLVLNELKPELEVVSAFFSVLESDDTHGFSTM